MLGRREKAGLEIVREFWQAQSGASDFERWWLKSLQKGVIEGTASPKRTRCWSQSESMGEASVLVRGRGSVGEGVETGTQ